MSDSSPKRARLVRIAALVAVGVGASGCAASGDGGAGSERLSYLEAQAWITLYPPDGGFYPNGAVLNQIADRLLYQNTETLELEPWIAEELPEVNEDATEYTFTLREGVTYSDGTPLDAENVAKNIDLYGTGDADRALGPSETIHAYEGSEVVDERTVTFRFSEPAPGFAQAVSTINSGLLSDDTLDQSRDEFGPGGATEIVGSGPFVIVDEQIDTALTLDAREDYDWAPASREHQGAPQIAGIDLTVVEEASVRVGTAATGQADVARQIPPADEERFDAPGLHLFVGPTSGVANSLSLRFAHPLLEDIRVRQAIIAGIDREQIVETLFTDSYPLATGILTTTALGYVDTSDSWVHDPAEAERLLDEAGWDPGSDGIREKDGERLVIAFNEALPLQRSREVVTLIQEQLAEIGVGVELLSGDQATQNDAQQDIERVQVYHQLVGRGDYEVLKSQYFGANRNALLNADPETGAVRDEELENLLADIASEPTPEGRQAASEAAQRHLIEQAYVLPLFEEPLVYGLSDEVRGFGTESVGRPSFYDVSIER
ncbi:TIGR04028 family ABC transporter substrate-binding protein [Microbacterium sp. gxy059]|uniref:TIGR04028 family ABC transporter substrate-binding protein n=1 Tax=Microbacterium sp. gxy059 TaxID=2957199 RepID=UPI003D964CDE